MKRTAPNLIVAAPQDSQKDRGLGIRHGFVVLVKRPMTEMLMEQKTFSRSGLAVFSRNPLTLGRENQSMYLLIKQVDLSNHVANKKPIMRTITIKQSPHS